MYILVPPSFLPSLPPLSFPLPPSLPQVREDDDEVTNRNASMRGGGGGGGGRMGRQQSHDTLPTSHWNIDGDDLNRVDIEVRWA